ncbi:MAG: hypothetical protein NTW91_07305 [Verrucomicrobia bacterium]|nr:hypothetical protein [Verrucomicrobiota bacterium]
MDHPAHIHLRPPNAMVVAVLFACSLGIAAAIFLIPAMNSLRTQPIKASGARLRSALDKITQLTHSEGPLQSGELGTIL